jgi:ribosomal protein L24E
MTQWKELGRARDYLQNQAVHCQLCGKILPRRAWVVSEEGCELVFCDSDCERLYREYWLPRYRTATS